MRSLKIRIFFLVIFYTLAGSAFSDADLGSLIKFQDHLEFLLNFNLRTINKKLECAVRFNSVKKQEVEKQDLVCFAHLNEIYTLGKTKLTDIRVARSLFSTNPGHFLSLPKDSYYQIPEKAFLEREISHNIYDINITEFKFDSIKLSPLTEAEILSAKERFSNFIINSLRIFKDTPEFSHATSYLNPEDKQDLFKRFLQLALTHPFKRSFRSKIQKAAYESLIISCDKFIKSRYLELFREMVSNEYTHLVSQFPYLTLFSGPQNYKTEVIPVFQKMSHYAGLTYKDIKTKQDDPKYKELKDLFQKNSRSLSPSQKKELVDKLRSNFEFKKASEFFLQDLNDSNEKVAFTKHLNSAQQKENTKHLIEGGLILTSTILCILPLGQSENVVLKLFNFARTGTAKLACGVALMTPISIFYLVSNHHLYQRTYQLLYSRGSDKGIYAEFSDLEKSQKSFLTDLLLSPLNLTVIADIIKSSQHIQQSTRKLIWNRINTSSF